MTRESTQAVFLCLKRRKGREKQGKSQGVWVTDYEWRMRNMIHDTRLVTETREITRYFPGWRRKRRVLSSILLFQETEKEGDPPDSTDSFLCLLFFLFFAPARISVYSLSLSLDMIYGSQHDYDATTFPFFFSFSLLRSRLSFSSCSWL